MQSKKPASTNKHLSTNNVYPAQRSFTGLVSKALNEENSDIELPEEHTKETMNNKIFKMKKTRREKAGSEFTFKTSRISNSL